MPEKIFKTNPERLDFLLDLIHNRQMSLPDFQRDFVWDPSATEELIESMCQSYPAGSLLKIRNSTGFFFAPREFKCAPALDGRSPVFLILDGQQRLTSLYQALYGVGDHRYLMSLQSVLEGLDMEDCVFHLRKADCEKRYARVEQQASDLVMPLSILFVGGSGFEGWLDGVLEARAEADEARVALKERLRQVRRDVLQPLEQYEFPVVELADSTSAAAVCTIFETLNRTGVKLSVFDLLGARFWPEDVRLRDLWDRARNEHPVIADFQVDPYYVLQAIAIRSEEKAPSCKRKDVLAMKSDEIRSRWDDVVFGLSGFLDILRSDCGVMLPRQLPYATMLVTASAALAGTRSLTGPSVGSVREKVKRWFWCSVLSQGYENAPNTQAAKDYAELTQWFSGASEPQVVAEFTFDAAVLDAVTVRQRALYRGLMALVLRNRAIDFHTREQITSKLMLDESIDDHHIFPDAFLKEHRPDLPGTLRDCILNRTHIDKITNIRIGKRPPSDYLAEIAEEAGDAKLDEILASHMLPSGPDSPLRADDFEGVIEYRRRALSEAVRQATT